MFTSAKEFYFFVSHPVFPSMIILIFTHEIWCSFGAKITIGKSTSLLRFDGDPDCLQNIFQKRISSPVSDRRKIKGPFICGDWVNLNNCGINHWSDITMFVGSKHSTYPVRHVEVKPQTSRLKLRDVQSYMFVKQISFVFFLFVSQTQYFNKFIFAHRSKIYENIYETSVDLTH